MNKELLPLYDLQLVDTALLTATQEFRALDQGKAEEAAAASARATADMLARTLHETERDQHAAELELGTVEAKRKDYEDRLWGGKIKGSPRELEDVQAEIAALGRQAGGLEERILLLFDQVEDWRAKALEAETSACEAEAALAAKQALYKKKATALAVRIRDLQQARARQAELVQPGLRARYEQIAARHHGVGIARLHQGMCGACRTQVPVRTAHAVVETDAVAACENCGRLLCAEPPPSE